MQATDERPPQNLQSNTDPDLRLTQGHQPNHATDPIPENKGQSKQDTDLIPVHGQKLKLPIVKASLTGKNSSSSIINGKASSHSKTDFDFPE
jgi:hypothetical protein